MRRSRILIATSVVAMAMTGIAQADPGADAQNRFETTSSGSVKTSFVPSIADTSPVTVIVELSGDPVAVVEAKSSAKLSKTEKASIRASLKKKQDALAKQIVTRGGRVESQMQSAFNGMRVQTTRKAVADLAKLPGVTAVHSVKTFEPSNAVSVPYLGVPQVWQSTGYTGQGVKVAIIDTGIDHTHATFGGPGTTAAYEAANAAETQPANPAWFGPKAPRVKGGWDFVGDAYDGKTNTTPKPDPNPLDCNGHGSHVAGTTGGSGVLLNGSTYTGAYDTTTHTQQFKVGPGVAPEVDLYALRVFGCTGSTDVVTEAIDWAVANDMDVINMSLGSPYGTTQDPSAMAATNAAAAGVVVVASAGNSGPNPYLTGSPGTGRGVISVASNDSTRGFPGAILKVDGRSIEAINANGAELKPGPYQVVVLTDDPATAADESLGCQVSDYTRVGVSAAPDAPLQIAVTKRGSCARVARGVCGQQAGADAVVMINNAPTLPPYEGPITENPDTGEAYTVTIPFLGVRSTDGPALIAANGKQVTIAAKEILNPGYTKPSSFTSGGPRTGDSGLKPSVTAPGTSIVSAAVGSGSGAATLSGTSMAAPHVAGVAALGVQAHPTWTGQEVSAALVSTADASKVGDYRLTLAGGLVDTAQLVRGSTFAVSDTYSVGNGTQAEPTLSFGFAEFAKPYTATRTITVHNRGTSALTYGAKVVKTPQSRPASVKLSRQSVTVPAGGTATVDVTLSVDPADVPSSLTEGTIHRFFEVSGNVVFTASSGDLSVPYLLVPRSNSLVTASQNGLINPRNKGVTVTLSNKGGALDADADLYTWGLQDAADTPEAYGADLRAIGVQSFPYGDDTLLVFAVNSHDRYSNAASIQFMVPIDTNNDGETDYIVYTYDSGSVRTGYADGKAEVFIYNTRTAATSAAGFLPVNPTDSSTLLIPVRAASLGITGTFGYSGATSFGDEGYDEFAGAAMYDPRHKPINDAEYVTVPRNGTARITVTMNKDAYRTQKPLGGMVVVLDNHSGAAEALFIRGQ